MEKLTLRDIPSIHYRAVFGIRLDMWYLGKELFFAPSLISAEENDLFELSELVPPSSKELEDIFFYDAICRSIWSIYFITRYICMY